MLIEEILFTIGGMLDDAADSPHVRELRAKARSYERIVQQWKAVPPSNAQRDATLDLANELRSRVARLASSAASADGRRSQKS